MADDETSPVPATGKDTAYFLRIDTPLTAGAVVLLSVDGEDKLSRYFLYRVTVATRLPEEDIESLLGKPVTLWLVNNDPDQRRPINGHVRQLEGAGTTVTGALLYELEIVPRLWFLSCSADCRIFQNRNVLDIIKTIFDEHGLRDYEFRIGADAYPAREYVVQFQESAFDFVSRLMEHYGLFYWHEHGGDRHCLVIADRNPATDRVEPFMVRVTPNNAWGEISRLVTSMAFRPGKWTLNDYDFESPTKQLLVDTPTVSNVPRMVDHEIYEYPGKFSDLDEGRRLTRLRIEMEEARFQRAKGKGWCTRFDPGRRFGLERDGAKDKTFLLIEVRHHAAWAGPEDASGAQATYENEFMAVPVYVPYRPERLTPRPFIRGTQTATVVGPAGEQIYCDEYGRVKVQFHWDRRGQRDEGSSCWLRVAQGRSGAHYGSLMIPHVGHEVLVSFIEGDPDRPLITGTVPNADMLPAVGLPDNKHKTVQRDHGNNRMVMNGADGAQYFALLAPRHFYQFTITPGAEALSSGANPPPYVLPDLPNNSFAAYQDVQTALNTAYSATAPLALPASQQDISGKSYTVTESDADEYVGGNMNTWVQGTGNSWYGSTVTYVNTDSTTTIENNSTTTVKIGSNITNILLGANITNALGANITNVGGDNSSFVGGSNNAVYVGLNVAVNLLTSMTLNVGVLNFTLNVGPTITVNVGPNITKNYLELKSSTVTLTDDQVKLQKMEVKLESLETHLEDTITKLNSSEITLIGSDMLTVF